MTLKNQPAQSSHEAETPAITEDAFISSNKGGGESGGNVGSNTPPYKEHSPEPSFAEIQEAEREEHASALRFVMNRCQAVETLLEDVIDQIAAFNPDVVGAWRDQAAVNYQKIIDGDCPANEVGNRALYATRFEILEAVMVRAGEPYEAAEVVDLADARAQAAVRQTKPH